MSASPLTAEERSTPCRDLRATLASADERIAANRGGAEQVSRYNQWVVLAGALAAPAYAFARPMGDLSARNEALRAERDRTEHVINQRKCPNP